VKKLSLLILINILVLAIIIIFALIKDTKKVSMDTQNVFENNGNLPLNNTAVISLTASPIKDSRRIITIDLHKYDVTQFKYVHGGGDIFNCGTDMSQISHNQHKKSTLDKIQNYRI